jgi:hypothetical protein
MEDFENNNASSSSQPSSSVLPSGPPVDLSPLLSEDAVYKLGLLDYRTSYCVPQDARPFTRHFFACAPPNASSFQFNAFASITTWLLQMNKRPINPNAAGEDPATFVNRLLGELRTLGWGESVDRDLPLMKLRLGAGEPVCRVLLFLADKALLLRGFAPSPPDFSSVGGGRGDPGADVPEEIVDDNDAADDDAAALIDGSSSRNRSSSSSSSSSINKKNGGGSESKNDNTVIEEEGDKDDEEEELVLYSESAWGGSNSKSSVNQGRFNGGRIGGSSMLSYSSLESKVNNTMEGGGGGGKESDFTTLRADLASDKKLTAMIEPTVDAQVWRAEVDRVAPKLAAAPSGLIAGSSKGGGGGVGGVQKGEWRAHLEQSTHSNAIVASLLPTSKGSLERLSEDLSQLLEVVRGREKSINTTFKHLMVEHKACAEKTAESQLAVQAVQATVNKFSAELAAISDVLEEVKQNIEEKGNSVTDTSPLIKVKAALSSIRSECRSLDLQIGVVSHAVLQARITHKRSGPLSTEDDVGLNVN